MVYFNGMFFCIYLIDENIADLNVYPMSSVSNVLTLRKRPLSYYY